MHPNVSVIIPAYNEEKYIKSVINVVHDISVISEILVIDDGSKDNTRKEIMTFSKVRYHRFNQNRGKTISLLYGAKKALNNTILTLDADLINLQRDDILKMICAYQDSGMIILDCGGIDWVRRKLFKAFPALSGIRIFKKEILPKITFKPSGKFEFEHRINQFHLKNNMEIRIVENDKLKSPLKLRKYGLFKGLILEIRALREIFLCDGLVNVPRIIRNWYRIANLEKITEETSY